MVPMIAVDVAMGFNGVNERKAWSARPYAKDGMETVHFTAPANLVTLVLDCGTCRFQVRFNKVQASWGDYVTAIARSLHVVLSTLKQAGLPFEAPEDAEGVEITATTGSGVTYVAWPGMNPEDVKPVSFEQFAGLLGHGDPVADATMPGIRADA